MGWNNPFTFAYNSIGEILYAIMGHEVPSWWPTDVSTVTFDDNSSVPGRKLFKNQRGKPLANPSAPVLTPYFSVSALNTGIANQYTITAKLEDAPSSPPTSATFTINGTAYTASISNNTTTYTYTVPDSSKSTSITVSATGVADGYTTIMSINANTFKGAVETILLETTGIEVSPLNPPDAPTVTIESSGTVGSNLATSTSYSYGFTAVDAQGNETNLTSTTSVTTGATAYPIQITGSTVANAQSYWLYRNNVRLIQLASPSYIDTGSDVPTSTAPPSVNNTGVTDTGILRAGNSNQFQVDVDGNVTTTGSLVIDQDGKSGANGSGNLLLKHPTSGGYSSIVFASTENYTSDYAAISYTDSTSTYALWGTSSENSVLMISAHNDGETNDGDSIVVQPTAGFFVDLGPSDSTTPGKGAMYIGTSNSGSWVTGASIDVNGNATFGGTLKLTSSTAPLSLSNLTSLPAVAASGTICIVNGLWYQSDGSAWNAMSSVVNNASTSAVGVVEVSAAPSSGNPIAVSTSDSKWTTLTGGSTTDASAEHTHDTFPNNVTINNAALNVNGSGDTYLQIKGNNVMGSFPGWDANMLYINTYSNAGARTQSYSSGVQIQGDTTITSGLTVDGATTLNSGVTMPNNASFVLGNNVSSNVGMEIGSQTTSSSTFIDFHTSGSTNDYDARIIATGGIAGTAGSGTFTVDAEYFKMGTTRFVLPIGTNLY